MNSLDKLIVEMLIADESVLIWNIHRRAKFEVFDILMSLERLENVGIAVVDSDRRSVRRAKNFVRNLIQSRFEIYRRDLRWKERQTAKALD